MNLLNLQLSALLVLDPLSVILPFLWIFRLEWRYDAHRIAGILFGYLFIICGLFLFFLRLLPGFSRHGLIWSLLLMAFSLSLCLLLTKVKIQAAAYTLFLFKNVSDSASLLSRFLTVLITSHNPSIPHTACVRSLELLLIPAAVLIITAETVCLLYPFSSGMEKNAFDPRLFLSHVLYGYGAYLYAGASP